MKKIVVFIVLASLIFWLSSCIIVSGGNSEPMVGGSYEELENHFNFTYLGEMLQELQESVGLIEPPPEERIVVTAAAVGKMVSLLSSAHASQLKKEQREQISSIADSIDDISYELDLVSSKLDEINMKIDQQFYSTMDAFLESDVKSSVDARWNEYLSLVKRSGKKIGDDDGWPSVEEMNKYAQTVKANIEKMDLMKNIIEINKFITGAQNILNAYTDVLVDHLGNKPPYDLQKVKNAIALLRGYYLELVSYQIMLALFMVEVNQEDNLFYARDSLQYVLEYIDQQNEKYLQVSEKLAAYAGVELLNRTENFTNSSIVDFADTTIYELTLRNTINVRIWWTKDALKDPDAVMNGIGQNNLYYNEAYNQAYNWLEEAATSTISNLIRIPGIETPQSQLNQFDMTYYNATSTKAGVWRLTYFPETLATYRFVVEPQDSPVFEHDTVLDNNKINEKLIPHCYSNYAFDVTESDPVVSISIGAYMPEDRFYSYIVEDSGNIIADNDYSLHWLMRNKMDLFPNEDAHYNVAPFHDELFLGFTYYMRSLFDPPNENIWGIETQDSSPFLIDNSVVKIFTKQYYSLAGTHKDTSKTYYLKKFLTGSHASLDKNSKDAYKYTVKKKYLSFMGRIFDDAYIRYRDYFILYSNHKDTDYFLGHHTVLFGDIQELHHYEEKRISLNKGILNSDNYFCFTE